jgi:hypothetical protein
MKFWNVPVQFRALLRICRSRGALDAKKLLKNVLLLGHTQSSEGFGSTCSLPAPGDAPGLEIAELCP